jgi:hypothetical protein
MSTMVNAAEAHPDEVTFALAARLLCGETLELTDDVGRTWQATASTLSWRSGDTTELVLDRADAFDVLSKLARSVAGTSTEEHQNAIEYDYPMMD